MTFQKFVAILRALGMDGLCNFGIGSPRELPPLPVILRKNIAEWNPFGHGYAERQGRIKTRQALAANCGRTLGVEINPSQVLLLEGSKPAIRYVLQALRLVGKVVLPFPFYPGNKDGVLATDCEAFHLAMPSVAGFITNLRLALVGGLRPVAVVLSFDNPCWLGRTQQNYQDLVDLARMYGFLLISDEAYRDLAYDHKSYSVMQIEAWEKVAVCIQTASKAYCMAGHKVAALIATAELMEKIFPIKSKDSEGGSPAAQKAYKTALSCDWYPRRLATLYEKRAIYTKEALKAIGVKDFNPSCGGMFLYFRIPGVDSDGLASALQGHGFTVSPGSRFGELDMIRWCLNQPNWVTRRAVKALAKVLGEQKTA